MPYEDDLGELVEPPPKIAKVNAPKDSAAFGVEKDTNWKKLLASLTVDDLLKEKDVAGKKQLVVVKSSDTVQEVLHTLAQNNFLSAPVMDRDSSTAKCLGFVDVLDVVELAFKIMKASDSTLHEFFSNPLFEKKVKDALAGSSFAFDDWKPVEQNASLLEVLCEFTRPSLFRPHRLPVVDTEGTVIGIISQSDIVKVAAKNTRLLGDRIHETIETLKLEHAVIAARSNAPARDVFGLLTENRVHGIAIVEHPTSKLLANLSASDLRGMTRNDLQLFDKPVIEFLEALSVKKGATLSSPVTCRPKAELSEIISLLDDNDVHRVFVTDASQHAIGVISMGDVIGALRNC